MKKVIVMIVCLSSIIYGGSFKCEIGASTLGFSLKPIEYINKDNVGFYLESMLYWKPLGETPGIGTIGINKYLKNDNYFGIAYGEESNDVDEITSKGVVFKIGKVFNKKALEFNFYESGKDSKISLGVKLDISRIFHLNSLYHRKKPQIKERVSYTPISYNRNFFNTEKVNECDKVQVSQSDPFYKGESISSVLLQMGVPSSKYINGNYQSWDYNIHVYEYYHSWTLIFKNGVLQSWSEYESR